MSRLANRQLFDKAMNDRKERDARIYNAFRTKQLLFRGCGICVISVIKLKSRYIRDFRDKGMSFDELKEMGATKDWKLKLKAKLERKKDALERKAMDALKDQGIVKKIGSNK
jgi:hypothetical protein